MDFRPSPGQDSPGIGQVAALCAFQFAAAAVASLLLVFLSSGSPGMGAVGPLAGSMSFAVWAEGKAPGCLSSRYVRRLTFWSTLASMALSTPYLAYFMAKFLDEPAGPELFAKIGLSLLIVVPIAGAVSFLVTWFGLDQGRRIAARARRRKSGGA